MSKAQFPTLANESDNKKEGILYIYSSLTQGVSNGYTNNEYFRKIHYQ